MDIPIKRFDPDYPLPFPQPGAAAFDMVCRETVKIPPGTLKAVRQNFALKIPEGYVLFIFSRSSTPIKKGLMLANSVGVIDPFYCGDNDEVMTFFYNFSDKPVTVSAGDRIAQCMLMRTEPVTWREVESMQSDGHGGYRYLDAIG